MSLDQALLYVILAVSTAGLAVFMRAIPWPKAWTAVKPLACPACMSGWSGFAVLAQAWWLGWTQGWTGPHFALAWCFCLGVSAPIFKGLYPPEVELPLP